METSNSTDSESHKKLNQDQIKEFIPHREPFLFIDEIDELSENHVVAVKYVRAEEEFFKGHFPGNPILPGVIMLEAMAQAMGVMVLSTSQHRGKNGYYASIDKVRFRELVRPGDKLVMTVTSIKEKKMFYIAKGVAKVGDKLACEAEMMLYLANQDS